jgi:hypothetical protein
MVNMKILLSVLLAVAVLGCLALGVSYSAVQGTVNENANALKAAETRLSGVEVELAAAQSELQTVRDQLSTTETQLTTAEAKLLAAESKVGDVAAQLESVNQQSARVNDAYTALREEINTRMGWDEDSERIITPNDPAVAEKVLEVVGTFSDDWDIVWQDYQKMYQWVEDNIEYMHDTNMPILPETPDGDIVWNAEYWKLPSETLEDGSGDCEDIAGLLASMILNYNHQDYGVWAVVIHNETDGHVAVAIPVVDNKLAILDPPLHYYTGINKGHVTQINVYDAVDDWLATWQEDMPNSVITAAFSYDFYKEFQSTQEFIDWASDK